MKRFSVEKEHIHIARKLSHPSTVLLNSSWKITLLNPIFCTSLTLISLFIYLSSHTMMETFNCQCRNVDIGHILDACLAFAKQWNIGHHRFIKNLDVSHQIVILMLVWLINPADTVSASALISIIALWNVGTRHHKLIYKIRYLLHNTGNSKE
jgi:hypothetical protein